MTASGVDTTLSAARIVPAEPRTGGRAGQSFEHLDIGQNLKLRVIRQLDQQRYEVAFGGNRHLVDSRVPLTVGAHVEARVEAKGRQLELHYLSTDSRFEDEQQTEEEGSFAAPDADLPPVPRWLDELAAQYRVTLDTQTQAQVARAASQVAQPQLLARGALFLQKMARSVTPRDLEALYHAMSVARPADKGPALLELDDLSGSDDDATALADAMDTAAREVIDTKVPRVGEDATDGDREGDARRARRLLNLQDEGSVAWRYGTLPLLVGGQLIELELVMFREREQKAARGGLKRLVMTLDTTHFGRVRIEARASDDRLLVKMQAPTADGVEVMAGYARDVRAAIERLGWQVDDIRYEVETQAGRASQAVVDHVLSSGSVDREL